ncbi:RagB/SusD family nutrient uptake outer membrane protein [Cloacibacterium sp.]|uniref:RagB/SusD family nutrient uptake outer membrane protein n=1 Tax=Cloacibacterium sp. TaxID=1913682 RepID=UPI0039E38343
MKNKNILIGVMFGVLSLVSSCRNESSLSPENETGITDASAFTTSTRIEGVLLSVYSAYKSGNVHGGRYVVYNDIRGVDVLKETDNLVTAADVFSQNPTNSSSSITSFWTSSYYAINNANLFIDGMNAGGTSVVGEAKGKVYIAEVKALRAMLYYGLLQFFAKPYADGNGANPGLPLRLTGIKGSGSSNLARSTVAEVYTQILKDLNEAETDLPLANASAILNTSRVHRNTVVAFKTRVYLSMQKYAEAVTEANKIVSNSAPFVAPSGVANKLEANIATVFTNYTTTESIFSLPMSSTAGDFPGTQNQIAYYWTPVASLGGVGNGEYSVNPSGILANTTQFTVEDKRRAFIVSSNSGTKLWNMKFKTPNPYTDWVPVIRYSEVLLNLAEAKVRASNVVDSQSLALLNAVHGRSDAGKVFVAGDFSTPSEFLLAIDNERRMEFMGEGHRTRDVTRLLSAFPAHGTAPAKALGDVGYIWPIPSLELSLNTLCVDN